MKPSKSVIVATILLVLFAVSSSVAMHYMKKAASAETQLNRALKKIETLEKNRETQPDR